MGLQEKSLSVPDDEPRGLSVDDDGNFVGTLTEAKRAEVRVFFDSLYCLDGDREEGMIRESWSFGERAGKNPLLSPMNINHGKEKRFMRIS